jgi:ATP-binding protein involved in chromosome partitioning
MPPGIGDETLDVIRLVKKSEFLVVTTPSKVAMGAVSKLLLILKELKLPVIGVVENMKMIESDYIKNLISSYNLTYLNSIIFDNELEKSIGVPDRLNKSNFMKDLDKIVEKINKKPNENT